MVKLDIQNKRFGSLVAVEPTTQPEGIVSRAKYWLCLCDCGKPHKVKRSSLLREEIKSCGCRHAKVKENSVHWKGCGELYGDDVSNIRRSAKYRKIVFELDAEFLWELFLKQERKCYLTGVELFFSTRSGAGDGNASLDRIDSNLGYVKSNVAWVEKTVNRIKSDLTLEEFKRICSLITENENRKITSSR